MLPVVSMFRSKVGGMGLDRSHGQAIRHFTTCANIPHFSPSRLSQLNILVLSSSQCCETNFL